MREIADKNLFDRVVSILEEARNNVVRAVNSNMVAAYWLIGREIVEEIQGGEKRAEYGKKVIEELALQLTKRYGEGFSLANIKNFRQFYIAFADRIPQKSYPAGSEFNLLCFSPQLTWSHYRALMRVSKKESVAKYSVLNDRKQIFASKYMLYLPTEEELKIEIERERKLIEAQMCENND